MGVYALPFCFSSIIWCRFFLFGWLHLPLFFFFISNFSFVIFVAISIILPNFFTCTSEPSPKYEQKLYFILFQISSFFFRYGSKSQMNIGVCLALSLSLCVSVCSFYRVCRRKGSKEQHFLFWVLTWPNADIIYLLFLDTHLQSESESKTKNEVKRIWRGTLV